MSQLLDSFIHDELYKQTQLMKQQRDRELRKERKAIWDSLPRSEQIRRNKVYRTKQKCGWLFVLTVAIVTVVYML